MWIVDIELKFAVRYKFSSKIDGLQGISMFHSFVRLLSKVFCISSFSTIEHRPFPLLNILASPCITGL